MDNAAFHFRVVVRMMGVFVSFFSVLSFIICVCGCVNVARHIKRTERKKNILHDETDETQEMGKKRK